MSTEARVRYFDRYVCALLEGGCPEYKFEDKTRAIDQHIIYMLNRTQSMFRWSGLPETIPQRILELYLQINGNVCFYEYENELYIFVGGRGGPPDVYYMPTLYTIANPALKISKTLKIDEECVVVPNDTMYQGLIPLFSRYATAMTETELSLNIATINSRSEFLISAPDDRTKESAEKYLEDVRAGKLGVIGDNAFLDGVKIHGGVSSTARTITDLIELEQYFKASWYNEIGLNANYNMKRESINAGESQLNNDALLPMIDDMLKMRQIGAEKVNEMYGTEITVELASSWEDNVEEIALEHEQITETMEPSAEMDGEEVADETDET